MRILVDCRYVRVHRHDGISRYTAGLAAALAALHPIELLISDERQLTHLPDVPWHLVGAPTSILEPLLARSVNRLEPDVVFSPMQTMGSLGRRYRLVLTVHDLIYYRHRTPPHDLPAAVRLLWRLYHQAWWPQRLLLDRADAVAVVSRTTADLVATHRLTRRPVAVVANAADPAPRPVARRRPANRDLVYMGSFMPYKDVETLAVAMAKLPDHRLHLMSAVSAGTRTRLEELAAGGGELVFHDGASDETYRDVLATATALLSASRDEGFGLPVLEAMALGVPVVLSDIPAFREVAADAGSYVTPGDAAGFAAAVRALDDDGEWAHRSAAALDQSTAFAWDRSARALLDTITAVSGENAPRTSILRRGDRDRARCLPARP